MTPGPKIYRQCPRCLELMYQLTMASGNTFGSQSWSDGYIRSPMLFKTPALIRCFHCGEVRWLQDFPKAQEPTGQSAAQMRMATVPPIEGASMEDMLAFLHRSTLEKAAEIRLRIMIWHEGNHPRRKGVNPMGLTPEEGDNLRRLSQILSPENPAHTLYRAEIERELGHCQQCMAILDEGPVPEDHTGAAQEIFDLAKAGSHRVQLIEPDDESVWRYATRQLAKRLDDTDDPGEDWEIDPAGPPVFTIVSRDWWVKVLGMLSQNWALIDSMPDGTACAYFFQDRADSALRGKYRLSQLRNRIGFIDSIHFPSIERARFALRFNGFERLVDNPGPWVEERPEGVVYDARTPEGAIYSSGRYWKEP